MTLGKSSIHDDLDFVSGTRPTSNISSSVSLDRWTKNPHLLGLGHKPHFYAILKIHSYLTDRVICPDRLSRSRGYEGNCLGRSNRELINSINLVNNQLYHDKKDDSLRVLCSTWNRPI